MTIQALEPPIQPELILRKRKALREALLAEPATVTARIAILGGSTTADIRSCLELFLRKAGIEPVFYESGYNRYFEDVMFDNPDLAAFRPDLVFIHTTWRNLTSYPPPLAAEEAVEHAVQAEMTRFQSLWERIRSKFGCLIIQNNFDLPPTRSLGNLEASAVFSPGQFISRLNLEFAKCARRERDLIIHDIHFLSSKLGLDRWYDANYWFGYKMAVTPEAAVMLAHNLSHIIGAIYGRSRKCLVLDLDNTLWGGVIGDDGLAGLALGDDSAVGEAYRAFQKYVKELGQRGILLAVCSKNEAAIAKEGFSHPDSILRVEDFAAFKANWNPKYENIREIASELNIGLDSLVFVDDNPMERQSVASQLPMVAVPDVGSDVSGFAGILMSAGYFEPLRLAADDLNRSQYYADNSQRAEAQAAFATYDDFLRSLDMKAEIAPFHETYLERIAQLINKTNQFNLTTRRYTHAEVAAMAASARCITLYGRLADKFGDNGLVSVLVGRIDGAALEVDTWLMSCRVLKRGMEQAMFDALVEECRSRGIARIAGVYIPTAKNQMVADHYQRLGFELLRADKPGADQSGAVQWLYRIPKDYTPLNRLIDNANSYARANTAT